MQESPFQVKVYDKNFNFQAFVGDPISLVVTPRYNQTGTAALVVDLNHHATPYLLAEGARLVIFLREQQIMSGKIHQRSAQGPSIDGTLTVYLKDDFRLLHQVLGYPKPFNAITDQSVAHFTISGNAENVIKTVVLANMVSRLGLPVAVADGLFRGGTIPDFIQFRFQPLYEKLFPAIEQAGLGVTFQQGPDGSPYIWMDVYEPPVFPFTLTEESGVVASWAWTDEDPAVTHIIAGGPGEDQLRVFREARDTTLEAAHRDVWEDFQDARDADNADLTQTRANEALAEDGGPRTGFAVHLSETEHFQYGRDGLVVGALVTIDIGSVARTDILREVTLSYTRDEGLVTTPVVGEIRDSPDRTIANFLARLKKGINDLKVSK